MLDKEVQNVKSNEKWRRELMTLLMRENENKRLGCMMRLVSQIRDVSIDDVDTATKFLKVNKEYILSVLKVIEEHPGLDDEEIAEMLVD